MFPGGKFNSCVINLLIILLYSIYICVYIYLYHRISVPYYIENTYNNYLNDSQSIICRNIIIFIYLYLCMY